jgi:hypothetical protein
MVGRRGQEQHNIHCWPTGRRLSKMEGQAALKRRITEERDGRKTDDTMVNDNESHIEN